MRERIDVLSARRFPIQDFKEKHKELSRKESGKIKKFKEICKTKQK